MRLLSSFIFLLLLSLLSRPVLAQQESRTPIERKLFVDLQWTQSRYEMLFPAKDVGIQPMDNLRYTLGYWIRPRLAFQASFIRDQKKTSSIYYGTTDAGVPTSESFASVQSGKAIPLLLRYTLTRKPDHRVRFDVLAGLTAVYANYTLDLINTEAGVVTREYHRTAQADGTFRLTAGLSGRYRVFRQLDVVADATWSKNPKPVSYDQHRSLGNHWGITKSLSIGLNYAVGLRKQGHN